MSKPKYVSLDDVLDIVKQVKEQEKAYCQNHLAVNNDDPLYMRERERIRDYICEGANRVIEGLFKKYGN